MMIPSIESLAAHVLKLASESKIEVIFSTSSSDRAFRSLRIIRIRPVRSIATYAIALHELGHILARRHSGSRLNVEVVAWQWALDNALDGSVNKRFKDTAGRGLRSYLHWALSRQHRKRPPVIPDSKHPFWKLAQCYGAKAKGPTALEVARKSYTFWRKL